MQRYDTIIVGAGLAGATLAYILASNNQQVLVIDKNEKDTSSKVAAGLFNPITGRKLNKTWQARMLFDFAETFYREAEEALGFNFMYHQEVVRIFKDIEQQNDFLARSADDEYKYFIKKISHHNDMEQVDAPHGSATLKHSGYVDIPAWINSAIRHPNIHLLQHEFDFTQLILDGNATIHYRKEYLAKQIVFCTGVSQLDMPYFGWLPLRPSKGEVLSIKPEKVPDKIYNKNVFVLNRHDGRTLAGSTYYNDDLSKDVTSKAREEIKSKLIAFYKIKFEIENQLAGIRPASIDRRPILGSHPTIKTIFVFNGLGTKGVTLAPYFAHQLFRHMSYHEPIDKEVSVERFYKNYKE